jgi:hypothetical protein
VTVGLALAAAACGTEAAPGGPEINTDPVIPEENPESKKIPITLQEALGDFAGCMDLEIWMRTGIYRLPFVETNGDGECLACHTDGTAGTYLSDDFVENFDRHTSLPNIMRLVTGTVDERGNFNGLVPSGRYIQKGADSCPPAETGIPCHPAYTLPVNVEQAVNRFVGDTLDRWESGTCDAAYTYSEEP